MIPFFRKVLFYLFLSVYVITCPILLLHATGYTINPVAEQKITQTGLISLSTLPPEASVYVDGARYSEKTPTVLMELRPGNYRIKISRKYYRPWEETITVHAKEATVLEKILLLPLRFKPEILSGQRFESLIPLEGTSYLLLSQDSLLANHFLYHMRSQRIRKFAPLDSKWASARVKQIYHVPESSLIIIKADLEKTESLLYSDLRSKEHELHEFNQAVDPDADEIVWDPENDDALFVVSKDQVDKIDLKKEVVIPAIVSGIQGIGLADGKLYVIKNEQVIRYNSDGDKPRRLLRNRTLGERLFNHKDFFHISRLFHGILIFVGNDGALLSNRAPFLHLKDDLRGYRPDRRHSRMLVWTKRKIGVVDFPAHNESLSEEFEKSVVLRWIYMGGSDIRNAFWVRDSAYVVFKDKDVIKLLELFPSSLKEPEPLFKAKKNSDFLYSQYDGYVYYLTEHQNRLSRTPLVPADPDLYVQKFETLK